MNDFTIEKKLQLVQQVRSRHSENRYDLSNRERILYGKTTLPDESGYWDSAQSAGADEIPVSSFKLRLLLALFLFGIVVFMDRSQTAIGGLTSEKLYRVISADYEEKIEDWVETLSNGSQKPSKIGVSIP